VVGWCSEIGTNKPNLQCGQSCMFAFVRMGCRQIVVSCIRKYRASAEILFRDSQIYSTPVHVVLRRSVQEARETLLGKQQSGSMQVLVFEFPRIHFSSTLAIRERKG
jgi:hypothetical protein